MRPETFRPLSLAALTTTMLLVAACPRESRASDAEAGPPPILHVDDDAPAGGDGATWETAFRFLQDALAAASGETEIRVAQGLYEPDRREADPNGTGDRFASFVLVNGLQVIGGYAGLSGGDPAERDVAAFPTVLSGDLARDDEPDFGMRTDNSFHVLVAEMVGETAVIDGCCVRGGNAAGGEHGFLSDSGGGMVLIDASPVIVSCTFADNRAVQTGGAVRSHGVAGPAFANCAFIGNTATRGGGVAGGSDDMPTFDACHFASNTATIGGGAAVRNASFQDCIFDTNVALAGGAMRLDANHNLITNCRFVDNHADIGGAIWADSGTMAFVFDSQFERNTASRYGGALVSWIDLVLTRCTFTDNASARGGAAYTLHGSSQFVDCVFSGNHATIEGGAFVADSSDVEFRLCHFDQNSAPRGGGLAAVRYTQTLTRVLLDQCEFELNTASAAGGAVHVRFEAEVTMTNSGFTDNSAVFAGGAIYVQQAAPSLDRCDFYGNSADDLGGSGGAMAIEDGSHPLLFACQFENNHAYEGGAIATFFGSGPRFDSCSFRSNRAVFGGALHNLLGADIEAIACDFEANQSDDDGGAVFSRQCSPHFKDGCSFRANRAEGSGGAIYAWADDVAIDDASFVENDAALWGGAIHVRGSILNAHDCFMTRNVARAQSGSAIAVREDGVLVLNDSLLLDHASRSAIIGITGGGSATLERTIFDRNSVEREETPVLALGSGPSRITGCQFLRQDGAAVSGGAGTMTVADSVFEADVTTGSDRTTFERCSFADSRLTASGQTTVVDCIFADCSLLFEDDADVIMQDSVLDGTRLINRGATVLSGCLFERAPSTAFLTAGFAARSLVANSIFSGNSQALALGRGHHRFVNCTLFDNLVGFSLYDNGDQDITFANTIIWTSPSPDQHEDVSLFFCNVEGGWAGEGRGNIDANPLIPGSGNYRPQSSSPCIDAGWDAAVVLDVTDRDGDGDRGEFDTGDFARSERFVDHAATPDGPCGVVDIGAYELRDGTRRTRTAGDVDGDGRVGAADLLAILVAWEDTDSCDADVNADGFVDYADFLVVLARWIAT